MLCRKAPGWTVFSRKGWEFSAQGNALGTQTQGNALGNRPALPPA
jgi:hypothetical protein